MSALPRLGFAFLLASLPVLARAAPATPARVVSTVPIGGDLPAFVVPGAPGTTTHMVFLHGRCGHAKGYAEAMANAASTRGTLVAPQGDVACDGNGARRWSPDIEKLDARVNAALGALGEADPASLTDIVVIGYSEGAARAEALASRWPERYSRVILIGAPSAPSAARLGAIRGAVMMAGDRDAAQESMKSAARALDAAGVPATYRVLPDAAHGEMGSRPEAVMDEALTWLDANARP